MSHGREWFQTPSWPPLALCWHPDAASPQWAEGVRRHHHLHDHGPTPTAFTFARPFAPDGAPTRIDKARAKALAAGPPVPRHA